MVIHQLWEFSLPYPSLFLQGDRIVEINGVCVDGLTKHQVSIHKQI